MNFGHYLIRYFGTWFALALFLALCGVAHNARAYVDHRCQVDEYGAYVCDDEQQAASPYSKLQALGACINESEIARAIQEGRLMERDDLTAFLGRMEVWSTDPEVQSTTLPGNPPPQGLIDYIEAMGVYVFNSFSIEQFPREVQMAAYEHCRLAWMDHFDHGTPAPVFYDFPIGVSEPVYGYTGGG